MKIALSVADMSVGGIATFVLNLSQSLCQAGHEVLVVAQRQGEWWSRLAESGVHGYCLPRRRWDSVQQAARRFAAYVTVQQVDLLMVNIGIDNRLPMFALHLLPDQLPVMLVLHNDRPEVYALAAVNRTAWNFAVGVSPKVQQMAQKHFPQQAIYLIRYGITLPSAAQLTERADWAIPLRLLFAGRLHEHQKGILRLPPILAACRNQGLAVQLTVIGDGPDREHLMQLCQAIGIADLVTLAGFQPSEAVLAQMRAHHLFLLPSNYEGLPIVVLEAQANGCVPISSHLPGITDALITEGVTGKLVEPSDLSGFADAIGSFRTDARWYAYSQAGIDHAKRHYSIQGMAEQYLALFNALGQGAHPLAVPRSQLQRQSITPLLHCDALPQPVRRALQRVLRRSK